MIEKRRRDVDEDLINVSFELGPNLPKRANLTDIDDPVQLYLIIRDYKVQSHGPICQEQIDDGQELDNASVDSADENEDIFKTKLYESCLEKFESLSKSTSKPSDTHQYYHACCLLDFAAHLGGPQTEMLQCAKSILDSLDVKESTSDLSEVSIIMRKALIQLRLFVAYCCSEIDHLLLEDDDDEECEVQVDTSALKEFKRLLECVGQCNTGKTSKAVEAEQILLETNSAIWDYSTVLPAEIKRDISNAIIENIVQLSDHKEVWHGVFLFHCLQSESTDQPLDECIQKLEKATDNDCCTDLIVAYGLECLGHALIIKVAACAEDSDDSVEEYYNAAMEKFSRAEQLSRGSRAADRIGQYMQLLQSDDLS